MMGVDHAVDIELVGIGEGYRPQCDIESSPPSPTGSSKSESRVTPGTSLHYEDDEPLNAVSLPPTDRGFHAWAYLVSAWMIELLVWSFPFSYGVFLNYYTSHTFKDNPSSLLALVGSLSTGIMYLSAVIITPIVSRYPRQKKNIMAVGVTFCVTGLVGAAFSTKPWQLVITQGIIYAIGGSCLYFPVITYVFEWFAEKRGLANGLIFSGTGIGGVVVPFVVESLLNKYGPKTALLSLAVAFLVLSIPTFPYIKSRLPLAQVVAPKSLDIRFVHYWPFWILFLANIIQSLGTYLPNLYLPTFAEDIKLSTIYGTVSLSLLNGASVPGLIFLGWLSDRYDIRFSILLSTVGSSLAVFLLWGLCESLAPLLLFSCVYGFLASSWCALYPRFSSSVAGDDPHLSATMMSVFIAGRGIGNVLSAPISGGLQHPWILTGHSAFAYGLKGYGPLITFTGVTLGASSLGIAYRSFGHMDPNAMVVPHPRPRRDSSQTRG